MLGRMTGGTKPFHIEGAIIALMMGVGLFASANFTWLTNKLAALNGETHISASLDLDGVSDSRGLILDRVVLHPGNRARHERLAIVQIMYSSMIPDLVSMLAIVGIHFFEDFVAMFTVVFHSDSGEARSASASLPPIFSIEGYATSRAFLHLGIISL